MAASLLTADGTWILQPVDDIYRTFRYKKKVATFLQEDDDVGVTYANRGIGRVMPTFLADTGKERPAHMDQQPTIAPTLLSTSAKADSPNQFTTSRSPPRLNLPLPATLAPAHNTDTDTDARSGPDNMASESRFIPPHRRAAFKALKNSSSVNTADDKKPITTTYAQIAQRSDDLKSVKNNETKSPASTGRGQRSPAKVDSCNTSLQNLDGADKESIATGAAHESHPTSPSKGLNSSIHSSSNSPSKALNISIHSSPNSPPKGLNASIHSPLRARPAARGGDDIRTMLAERFNVQVSSPKKVTMPSKGLVPYSPSSSDTQKGRQTSATGASNIARPNGFTQANLPVNAPRAGSGKVLRKGNPDDDNASLDREALPWAGRGKPRSGRPDRAERWPAKIPKQAPKRHEWSSDEPSLASGWSTPQADPGFGVISKDNKNEWNGWGGLAPPPMDWDNRPTIGEHITSTHIEEWLQKVSLALHGLDTRVNIGTAYGYSFTVPDKFDGGKDESSMLMETIASRHWIPGMIEGCSANIFWSDHIASLEPAPVDKQDLKDAKPWWNTYPHKRVDFLAPYRFPSIAGIDPDETTAERTARENDLGSGRLTESRAASDKAKKQALRQKHQKAEEKKRRAAEYAHSEAPTERFKPELNIYLRSATRNDVHAIRGIYNYYIDNSLITPERDRRTDEMIRAQLIHINQSKLPFIVACERGGRPKGFRRRKGQEDFILPEKVVGFACADEYNDDEGLYRFTAEVEIYTHKDHYMKGIGKCLMDKLMALLDPDYLERGKYDTVGDDMLGLGAKRVIRQIILNYPYDAGKTDKFKWVSRWLKDWAGFEQVGHLAETGDKDGKVMNLAIFQRATGDAVNAVNPAPL